MSRRCRPSPRQAPQRETEAAPEPAAKPKPAAAESGHATAPKRQQGRRASSTQPSGRGEPAHYVVQVAALADAAKAKQLQKQMAAPA